MPALDKWRIGLPIAALAAAGLALRLLHVNTRPFWLDEAWSHWFTSLGWQSLLQGVVRYETHPPLFYSALKLWRVLAGESPLALRSLSAIASTATLALVLALGKAVQAKKGQASTMVAAFALAAFSPPLIEAARQARPYALLILSFTVGLFAVLSLALKWRRGGNEVSWRLWATYGVALEFTLWLHTLGALHAFALFLSLSLALWAHGVSRERLFPFLSTHFLAGLLWLPAAAILSVQQKTWSGATWLTFRMDMVPGELVRAIAAPGIAGGALISLGVAGAFISIGDRERRIPALILLIAAIVPFTLEILLSSAITPIFLGRTLAPSAVPVILLACLPLAHARRPAVPAAATLLSAASLLSTSWQIVVQRPEERWHEVGMTLARQISPRDEIWLLPNELLLPFQLANPRLAQSAVIRPLPCGFPAKVGDGPHPSGTTAVSSITPETARNLVADARKRGVQTIWVIMRFPWLFDPDSALRTSLAQGATVNRNGAFAPLLIYRYEVTARAVPAAGALAH